MNLGECPQLYLKEPVSLIRGEKSQRAKNVANRLLFTYGLSYIALPDTSLRLRHMTTDVVDYEKELTKIVFIGIYTGILGVENKIL